MPLSFSFFSLSSLEHYSITPNLRYFGFPFPAIVPGLKLLAYNVKPSPSSWMIVQWIQQKFYSFFTDFLGKILFFLCWFFGKLKNTPLPLVVLLFHALFSFLRFFFWYLPFLFLLVAYYLKLYSSISGLRSKA